MPGRVPNELCKRIGLRFEILQIENAFREPAKESRVASLEHFAARAENGGRRIQLPPERDKLMFVAAGAVEHEQRPL